MDLSGKVVLVTGAGRGIGSEIVRVFADKGASVAINYLNSKDLAEQLVEQVRSESQTEAFAFRADVSNLEQVQSMVQTILDKYGKIDVLVNNAGVTRRGSLLELTESDWDMVMNVNLKGTFFCSQTVARFMLNNGSGSIVNISSIRGIHGSLSSANYAVSKAGIITLTKCMAMEFAPVVRVNCVAPGYILTDIHDNKTKEQIKDIEQGIPLKRFGVTNEVAEAVIFLASDKSSYITGETIVISGGFILG